MKRQSLSVYMICFALLSALCGCKVSGTVTDAVTGEPIKGVTVKLYESSLEPLQNTGVLYTATTDENGCYTMKSSLSFLSLTKMKIVRFSKDGHMFFPDEASVQVAGKSQDTVLDSKGLDLSRTDIYTDNYNYTVTNAADLAALAGYSAVKGDLVIMNTDLADLDLLLSSKLKVVGGKISISDNGELLNIKGLSDLNVVGKGLTVKNNAKLQSLECISMSRLNQGRIIEYRAGIDNTIWIENNPAPKSLKGLDSGDLTPFQDIFINTNNGLEHFGPLKVPSNYIGWIQIYGNTSLLDLSGLSFSDPSTFEGILQVDDNPSLTSLSGLENMTTAMEISISGNESLTDISALSGLTDVLNWLSISDNPKLTDLKALKNLETAPDIEITGNETLEELGLVSLKNSDHIKIMDNPNLCTYLAEELAGQISVLNRLGLETEISGNKDCSM